MTQLTHDRPAPGDNPRYRLEPSNQLRRTLRGILRGTDADAMVPTRGCIRIAPAPEAALLKFAAAIHEKLEAVRSSLPRERRRASRR